MEERKSVSSARIPHPLSINSRLGGVGLIALLNNGELSKVARALRSDPSRALGVSTPRVLPLSASGGFSPNRPCRLHEYVALHGLRSNDAGCYLAASQFP